MVIVNQDGPACTAQARLLGLPRSRRSRHTSTSTGRSSARLGLADEHLPLFDVAVGERAISHMGHIEMMGAVQPFISGAISKTVNMPAESTVEDIMEAYNAGLASRHQGARDLPRRLEDGSGASDRREGQEGSRVGQLGRIGRRRAVPHGTVCRASASRSPTSSRSPAMRVTSPQASTRTARSVRSSSPTSARTAPPCAG